MTGSLNQRSYPARRMILGCIALILLPCLGGMHLPAQGQPPVTLHMYEVLAQTTVLVVGNHDKLHPPLTASDFQVSIDSGHPIHPRHIRVEGSEPIDLSILIDLSQPVIRLDPALDDAIASVFAMYLPPESRISIYFLNCHLTRTLDYAPAEPPVLKTAVASGLAVWRTQQAVLAALPRGSQSARLCPKPAGLWDALAFIAKSTSNRTGHRVILAISTGISHRSDLTWNEVRRVATAYSVAIFGMPEQLIDQHDAATRRLFGEQTGRYIYYGRNNTFDLPTYSVPADAATEDAFSLLCGLTGGVRFGYKQSELPVSTVLPYFITLVRGRYVIDFHPSSDLGRGMHQLGVKVPNSYDFALATGLTISVSALQRAGSSTPDAAVQEGKRRILSPNEKESPAAPNP